MTLLPGEYTSASKPGKKKSHQKGERAGVRGGGDARVEHLVVELREPPELRLDLRGGDRRRSHGDHTEIARRIPRVIWRSPRTIAPICNRPSFPPAAPLPPLSLHPRRPPRARSHLLRALSCPYPSRRTSPSFFITKRAARPSHTEQGKSGQALEPNFKPDTSVGIPTRSEKGEPTAGHLSDSSGHQTRLVCMEM
eukprot:6179059-Pleurochrysis_carterae.AAC.2